jgi:hypothetical protein
MGILKPRIRCLGVGSRTHPKYKRVLLMVCLIVWVLSPMPSAVNLRSTSHLPVQCMRVAFEDGPRVGRRIDLKDAICSTNSGIYIDGNPRADRYPAPFGAQESWRRLPLHLYRVLQEEP